MATSNVGAKRSLFKKPAWASTSAKVTDVSDTPIFGHSHLYEDILQAQKKQREQHAKRQEERTKREKQKELERQVKRRRISDEADDSDVENNTDSASHRSGSVDSQDSQDSHRATSSVAKPAQTRSRSTPQKQKGRLVDRLDSPRTPRTRSQKESTAQQAALVLDDDSDEAQNEPEQEDSDMYNSPQTKKPPTKQKPKRQQDLESESEEEDEYLRQLKAEARQKARLKQLGIGTGKENTPNTATSQTSLLSSSPGDEFASPRRSAGPDTVHATRAASTPDLDDPEVKIWIKTIIPGAKDLIVNRKISQPLDKVKEFWIKRNELDPAIAAKVFFTWNNTRLYNSTTMRGIIERLKKTHPLKNGGDPSNGQIMIEAVTDEIFEYRQKQKARRLAEAETQARSNDIDHDEHPDTNTAPASQTNDLSTSTSAPTATEPQPKEGIIIKLKAQGLEEMMLRVRPNTTVSKILSGYCRVRKVDLSGDTQCWLSYDGDRLDNDATVEDVGFEHDDSVDVYIR